MKLANRKYLVIISFLILFSSGLIHVESKLKTKNRKHKQIVLGRPPAGSTVVSPMVEADELPRTTVINVPVTPKLGVPSGPGILTTPEIRPAMRPVQQVIPTPLSQTEIYPSSVSYFPSNSFYDPNSMVLQANNYLRNGNINKSLDYYANALDSANTASQEDKIIDDILNNLINQPEDLASKLEEKVTKRGKKKDLAEKIKNIFQMKEGKNNLISQNNNSKKAMNSIKVEEKIKQSEKKGKSSNENGYKNLVEKESNNGGNIISLEPKKKVLRLNYDENSEYKNDNKLIKNLITWANEEKIQMKKLRINPHSKVTGEDNVKAGEKIKKGDKIMIVPSTLVIYLKNPMVKDICEKIKKISYFKTNFDKVCMTLYLLTSNDETIKPYIDFIHENTHFETFPFFYKKKELKLLEGSYFSSLVAGREESMNFEYKVLTEDGILPKSISKEEYFKARINVMSKNYLLKDTSEGGKGTLSALVPFADLFNHTLENKNAKIQLTKDGSVEIQALGNIKKNEAIYTFYGKKSNYRYLLYYGFVEDNNSIPIEIFLDLKVKNGNPKRKYEEISLSPNLKINSTLKNFRKLVANINAKTFKRKNYDNPISIDNEIESLRLLKVGLKSQLLRYPTTLQQDIQKFKSRDLTQNMYNILTILIEEKKIIIKYYNSALIFYKMLKKAKQQMQSKTEEKMVLTRKISKLINNKKYIRDYYNLLVAKFKLNIELNEEHEQALGENFDLAENELQNDGEMDGQNQNNLMNDETYGDSNIMNNLDDLYGGNSLENNLPNVNDVTQNHRGISNSQNIQQNFQNELSNNSNGEYMIQVGQDKEADFPFKHNI